MNQEEFADQFAEVQDEINKYLVEKLSERGFSIDKMVIIYKFMNQDDNGNVLAALAGYPGDITDEDLNEILGTFVE
jgi:hypothetical protein